MRPRIDVSRQTKAVKLKMQNMAERASRDAQAELEKQSEKVMQVAMKFAPHKTGALDNPKNWEIVKARDGLNRRNTFTVRLKEGAVARRIGKNNQRVVKLREYSKIMHDSTYKLGKKSKEKARKLGLAFSPISGGEYVGRLYLTRAANNRRLATHNAVLNSVKRALNK